MLTKQEIAGLRELLAKATPGPWVTGDGDKDAILSSVNWYCVAQANDELDEWEANASLIADAISALPALLDIAEAVANAPVVAASNTETISLAGGNHWHSTIAMLGPTAKELGGKRVALIVLPLAGEVVNG